MTIVALVPTDPSRGRDAIHVVQADAERLVKTGRWKPLAPPVVAHPPLAANPAAVLELIQQRDELLAALRTIQPPRKATQIAKMHASSHPFSASSYQFNSNRKGK